MRLGVYGCTHLELAVPQAAQQGVGRPLADRRPPLGQPGQHAGPAGALVALEKLVQRQHGAVDPRHLVSQAARIEQGAGWRGVAVLTPLAAAHAELAAGGALGAAQLALKVAVGIGGGGGSGGGGVGMVAAASRSGGEEERGSVTFRCSSSGGASGGCGDGGGWGPPAVHCLLTIQLHYQQPFQLCLGSSEAIRGYENAAAAQEAHLLFSAGSTCKSAFLAASCAPLASTDAGGHIDAQAPLQPSPSPLMQSATITAGKSNQCSSPLGAHKIMHDCAELSQQRLRHRRHWQSSID